MIRSRQNMDKKDFRKMTASQAISYMKRYHTSIREYGDVNDHSHTFIIHNLDTSDNCLLMRDLLLQR